MYNFFHFFLFGLIISQLFPNSNRFFPFWEKIPNSHKQNPNLPHSLGIFNTKLSQYVSLANIFSNGEIPELEIVAYEKEDIDKLMHFMING